MKDTEIYTDVEDENLKKSEKKGVKNNDNEEDDEEDDNTVKDTTSTSQRAWYKRLKPEWLKYNMLIALAALVYILAFSDNNIFKSYDNQSRIQELKADIKVCEDSAAYFNAKIKDLSSSNELVEKVAREQYHMKKANEDIYITDIK